MWTGSGRSFATARCRVARCFTGPRSASACTTPVPWMAATRRLQQDAAHRPRQRASSRSTLIESTSRRPGALEVMMKSPFGALHSSGDQQIPWANKAARPRGGTGDELHLLGAHARPQTRALPAGTVRPIGFRGDRTGSFDGGKYRPGGSGSSFITEAAAPLPVLPARASVGSVFLIFSPCCVAPMKPAGSRGGASGVWTGR